MREGCLATILMVVEMVFGAERLMVVYELIVMWWVGEGII